MQENGQIVRDAETLGISIGAMVESDGRIMFTAKRGNEVIVSFAHDRHQEFMQWLKGYAHGHDDGYAEARDKLTKPA